MDGSDSGGGKLFGRFSEPAHRALDQAREEAEQCGHRYLGPEHVLLAVSPRVRAELPALRAYGMDLLAARAALARLADRGSCRHRDPAMPSCWFAGHGPGRRPARHRAAVRRRGGGGATWRVTRRRGWWGRWGVWTPLCGPPLLQGALQLAGEQAYALGHDEVSAEHLLLGVLEDARQPLDLVRGSRRQRIAAHVDCRGLPGAARLLLAALEVDLDHLREAVAAEVVGVQR